jgi:hypothetical protein
MTRRDEPIRPMTLGNMRSRGVRGLFATCRTCGGETEVDVDPWQDDTATARQIPVDMIGLCWLCLKSAAQIALLMRCHGGLRQPGAFG